MYQHLSQLKPLSKPATISIFDLKQKKNFYVCKAADTPNHVWGFTDFRAKATLLSHAAQERFFFYHQHKPWLLELL